MSQLLVTSRSLDRERIKYNLFSLCLLNHVNFFEIVYHLCPLEHLKKTFCQLLRSSYFLAYCLFVCAFYFFITEYPALTYIITEIGYCGY